MKKYITYFMVIVTALFLATSATKICLADDDQGNKEAVANSEGQAVTNSEGQAVSPTDNNIVQTLSGKIEGFTQDGVRKFFGVPYAKPPVGELRFKAPVPMDKWEGVRPCLHCGADPIQPQGDITSNDEPSLPNVDGAMPTNSEDCLYLNVFAPPDAKDAPVFVWIHGGAWIMGSGSESLYDGSEFAKDGIIVVSINYRLGGFGYISHPEIADGASLGLLDQIQALKWVRKNIKAFGGDPRNVTVGGESAGAFNTSALIMSPLAHGLFQQAILESGNFLSLACWGEFGNSTLASVQQRTREIMQNANCSSAGEFVACPAETILKAAKFTADFSVIADTKDNIGMVADGHTLPSKPLSALREGKYNRVRLLCGFNRDESTTFLDTVTIDQYNNYIDACFGDKASEIKERFPADESNVSQRFRDLLKYQFFVGGTKIMADKISHDNMNVYFYSFDYLDPRLADFPLGVAHSLEIPFVFKVIPDKYLDVPATAKMVDTIHNYWANFIKNGSPNAKGLPTWLRYNSDGKNCMVFKEEPTMEPIPDLENINFVVERMTEK